MRRLNMRPLNWGCRGWRRDHRAELTRAVRLQLGDHRGRCVNVGDGDGVGSDAECRRYRGLRAVVHAEQGGDGPSTPRNLPGSASTAAAASVPSRKLNCSASARACSAARSLLA